MISSCSSDYILIALLLVEEAAQAYRAITYLSRLQDLRGNAVMWWFHTNILGKLRGTLKWIWVCICQKKAVSWQSALKAHPSNICVVLQIIYEGQEFWALKFWNFALSFLHGRNCSNHLWLSETRKTQEWQNPCSKTISNKLGFQNILFLVLLSIPFINSECIKDSTLK